MNEYLVMFIMYCLLTVFLTVFFVTWFCDDQFRMAFVNGWNEFKQMFPLVEAKRESIA